jgi:hypothetical protein
MNSEIKGLRIGKMVMPVAECPHKKQSYRHMIPMPVPGE